MTSELWFSGGAAALGAGALWAWRLRRLRRLALERLAEPFANGAVSERPIAESVLRRRRWVPWTLALLVGFALHGFTPLGPIFTVAIAAMVLVGSGIVEEQLFLARCHKLESQLSDVVDLVVGSLHAGSATLDALENASREAREPLRPLLVDLIGRIRLGDAPRQALLEFADHVPLETFRLFCFTLAVHEDVGGSLAPTLSTVGRTIRDRIELKRYTRAQTTQAQASVVFILAITYAIGLITWKSHPGRLEAFLASEGGNALAAGAVALQALGLLWMSRLSRIRF